MGLRINSNINSLIAIRNLGRAHASQRSAIERLSSGFRINRASDDPSGMLASNILLAQLGGIGQGIQNSQRALNTVQTADSALGEIVNLLNEIRTSALAAIGSTPNLIAGEQAMVDAGIAGISRIASTTRFGDRLLLNGQASINVTAKSPEITDLRLDSVRFYGASSLTFNISVTAGAGKAYQSAGNVGGAVTDVALLQVSGPRGTDVVTVNGGSSGAVVEAAVATVRANTGVYTQAGYLITEEVGSKASFRVQKIGGDAAATFTTVEATGVDMEARVNGLSANAVGSKLTISAQNLQGTILMDRATLPGAYSFMVANSGMNFQLGAYITGSDTYNIGLPHIRPEILGTPEYTVAGITYGGFLSDIKAGGASDLLSDPQSAVSIVDTALEEVLAYRAHLGGVAAYIIEPGISNLETQFVEISDAVSNIIDTDYAIETANLLRSQILLEAGIAVLGQATLVPTSVLDLLRM
ncbi:MAG: hypothetical protein E3J72_01135 [Planctomycetota bacterium]|nr:MAG: hypothetical protein E3J72_01135 [Planctomycetota bacterium]